MLAIHELIDDFIARLEVVPRAASISYGKIRANLQRAGRPIGNLETLIAAHAIELDRILVSNNLEHFKQVPQLKVENGL